MQLALRTPQDHGPLYDARGRAASGSKNARRLDAIGARTSLDLLPHLRAAARFSGRRRRPGHSPYGCALYLPEIRQGQEHEPAKIAVFILHIDSGVEMRGGQWQALYLMRGLAAAGHQV